MNSILLVDDHPLLGAGTKQLIEQEADMKVSFVQTAAEALDLQQKQEFDLYLYDLNLPDMEGLELVRRTQTDAPILIYSGFDMAPQFNLLLRAGAVGFISKASSPSQFIRSIRSALEGTATLPIELLRELRRREEGRPLMSDTPQEILLTEKDRCLLVGIAEGKSNKELAEQFYMSQRTVEYHLTSLFNKFEVHSRSEAVLAARRRGLI
ncbi:DNA-binding response regulator [Paenibacillus sp. CAA11]|uniref:response regulator transcription factor n=1 Tax=Paenibacillus sp. CAA11 TaxID=1532905 RepID=UPI000D3BA905|nr:response regulator transcription factor [Paenibacillus sp. CAA11]AWB43542.1 DNA-binding response regulator [Paenibacillus sp. CAA11]